MSSSCPPASGSQAPLRGRDLREVLSQASPQSAFEELTARLLFGTTLHAGGGRYRFREIEVYHATDPYTHGIDEQISTCGGWYFHRTKPGGGWKGGTFMGLDISFGPVGTAGGVLVRGLSRVASGSEPYAYFDGPCNCVKELLRACQVTSIKELTTLPNFRLDALDGSGIMRLEQHSPRAVDGTTNSAMEWKAASRVGLSAPEKKPDQAAQRQKFHLAPLRFVALPLETKKEKNKLKLSPTGGVHTLEQFQKLNTSQVVPSHEEKAEDNINSTDDDDEGEFEFESDPDDGNDSDDTAALIAASKKKASIEALKKKAPAAKKEAAATKAVELLMGHNYNGVNTALK